MDAVAYHVIPLKYDERNAESQYGKDETFFQEEKNGYGKLGASIRIEPNEHLKLRYGRMESDHVLLGPGDYRTTPRMYEMASAQLAWQPAAITLMHVTGGSDYSDDAFHKFSTFKRDWINGEVNEQPIQIMDFSIEKGPFGFKAAHGRQKTILNYSFLEASWYRALNESWSLQAVGGYRHKDVEDLNYEDKDHTLSMWGGEATLTRKNSWVKVAASTVETNPDFYGTMGTEWVLNGSLFSGCKDNGYYTTGVQGIFNHDGEYAQKIEIGHDADAGFLAGFSISAYYVEGRNIHGGDPWVDNLRQHEYGGRMGYIPPVLPGLVFEVEHGRNTMKSDGEYGMNQKMSTTLVNISYSMTLF